jgi:hypothetical protein
MPITDKIPSEYVTSEQFMELMDDQDAPWRDANPWAERPSVYFRNKFIERCRELGFREFRVRGTGVGAGNQTILWLKEELWNYYTSNGTWWPVIIEEVKEAGA